MVSSKKFSGGGVTASSPELLTNESEGDIIMASNGFDPNQARDKDGKWTDGNSKIEKVKDTLDRAGMNGISRLPYTIKLPDEQLPRSVGAKWANCEISMPDGTTACFVEGSKLQNKEVFAGNGCRRKIDEIDSLVEKYGGDPDKWKKVKAIGEIQLANGEIEKAEIHWYEEPSVGKVKVKRKKLCE